MCYVKTITDISQYQKIVMGKHVVVQPLIQTYIFPCLLSDSVKI